jgi:hypothetical protein
MLSFTLTFGAANLQVSMPVLCCDFNRSQATADVPTHIVRGLER